MDLQSVGAESLINLLAYDRYWPTTEMSDTQSNTPSVTQNSSVLR